MSFWHDHVKPMRAEFHRVFPKIFTREGDIKAVKRPLKIGIHLDLFEAFPSKDQKLIRLALHDYVQGKKYLKACFDGAERVDLQGKVTGFVTRAHRLHLLDMQERRERIIQKVKDGRATKNTQVGASAAC